MVAGLIASLKTKKMGKHLSDLMCNWCRVMGSDDDQPIVMEIYAGLTERDELMVSVDLFDYEERRYNCSTAVIVRRSDAKKIAKRHGISYAALPRLIADSMEEWREIVNANFEEVLGCFKEITECLLDEGCRMRFWRTYGKGGHRCC